MAKTHFFYFFSSPANPEKIRDFRLFTFLFYFFVRKLLDNILKICNHAKQSRENRAKNNNKNNKKNMIKNILKKLLTPAPKMAAEIVRNNRGGYSIAISAGAKKTRVGNYPTRADAERVCRWNGYNNQ